MHDNDGLLVELIEAKALVELALRGDGAGVALVVDPLHSEGLGRLELAHRPYLLHQPRQRNVRGYACDEDSPIERNSYIKFHFMNKLI